MFIEDGIVAQRKPDSERRVVLNFEQLEIERVLSEICGQIWKDVFEPPFSSSHHTVKI